MNYVEFIIQLKNKGAFMSHVRYKNVNWKFVIGREKFLTTGYTLTKISA